MRYVALLRGINVGGNNLLPMKELARLFETAGCVDVATYIQSGNVIFDATAKLARAIPTAIPAAIRTRFRIDVPVLVRSAAALEAVVAGNPYPDATEMLYVMFLADAPAAARVAALDPARSPGDTYVVRGQEIYLSLPGGGARSKLTSAYFDSKLATTTTTRNWRTTLKLAALAAR
jgi:uncharacterized protein (DUF1697 family)